MLTIEPTDLVVAGIVEVCVHNSSRTSQTVDVTIDNGEGDSQTLQITLDENGNGCANWTVPNWTMANFNTGNCQEVGGMIDQGGGGG